MRPDGETFTCEHCDKQVFVDMGIGVRHFRAKPALDRMRVVDVMHRILKQQDIKTPPVVRAVRLLYVPVWHLQVEGAPDIQLLAASCSLGDLKQRIRRPTTSFEFFHAKDVGDADVVEPTLFLEQARERVSLSVASRADLVHHPVWELRYELSREPFGVWLDGVDGTVWAGDFPRRETGKQDILYGLILLIFFGFFLLESACLGFRGGLLAVGLTAALLIAALKWSLASGSREEGRS